MDLFRIVFSPPAQTVTPVMTHKPEPITKLCSRRDQSGGGNKHYKEHCGNQHGTDRTHAATRQS